MNWIKKPFALIGFSFFIACFIGCFLSQKQSVLLLFGFLLLSLVSLILCIKDERFRQLAAVFLCFSSALLLSVSVLEFKYNKALEAVGTKKQIEGTIVSEARTSGGSYIYIIKTERIGNKEINIKLRLSRKEPLYGELYDKVSFKADAVYTLESKDSKADSIFLGAYTYGEIKLLPAEARPVLYYISQAREYITESIKDRLPQKTSGLMTGLMLGDVSGIDSSLMDEVRKTGTAHILSVSGLHVSLWSMFVYQLLSRFKRRFASGLISILFVFFVVAVTGFSSAAIRAGLMLSVFYLGEMMSKKAEPINSLGFSLFVICFINPFAATDVSLLLSFSATSGILLSSGKINEYAAALKAKVKVRVIKIALGAACTVFLISLAAVVFTLPVSVFVFGGISFIAPLCNIITLIPTEAAMLLCGLAILLSPFAYLSRFLFFLANLLIDLFIEITGLLSKLSFAYISVSKTVLIIAAATLPICLLLRFALLRGKIQTYSERKVLRDKSLFKAFLASLMVLLLGINISYMADFNRLKIYVPDVGNSSAVIITLNGRAALIGCGGEYNVPNEISSRLYRENVRSLDLLLLPRANETESGHASEIIKKHSPKYLFASKSVDPVMFIHNEKIESKRSDSAKIFLWECVLIEYINNETLSCAKISFAGREVLISFTPSSEFNSGDGYSNADLLIARSAYPKSLKSYYFEQVILSADSYKLGTQKESQNNSKRPVLMTAADSGIEIGITNNSLSIKRGD